MREMRILTVRQPWAWVIAGGFKSVENRTRNIAGDYRGLVAIHAAAAEDTTARQHPEIVRLAREQWRTTPSDLFTGMPEMFGHILAVANLYAVHQHDGSARFACCANAPDRYQRWAEPNAWHLCFATPRQLAQPVPFKGALGLRRLDEAMVQRIEAETA